MKTLEYYLPCTLKNCLGYIKPRKHEFDDNQYEFIINGIKYIFHVCGSCYKIQSNLDTSYYGFYVIMMDYIFNQCAVFEMRKLEFTKNGRVTTCGEPMEWCRNNDYRGREKYDNDKNWIKIDNDSYNTFYLRKDVFL